MLVNLEVPWVILGHSERRALLNESNEVCVEVIIVGAILQCILLLLNFDTL